MVDDLGIFSPANFEADGYQLFENGLRDAECAAVSNEIDRALQGKVGSRNLLEMEACRELAATLKQDDRLRPLLPGDAVAVQCTLFDKSSAANWFVSYHQDLSTPVREHCSHYGCTGWTQKEGVTYVQPPPALLESLVAVRVHLDDCGSDNGALRVIPGTHRHGRLSDVDINSFRQANSEVACPVPRGGLMLMRPLLLHASSKAKSNARRRVLHLLFGPAEPGFGLQWHRAV